MSIANPILDIEGHQCQRIIAGLQESCCNIGESLHDVIARLTRSTIEYILDGELTVDDLEACEKAQFGVKIEKRVIRALGLPRKISKVKNPHGLRLDTRIGGVDLDFKATLGGKTWMIPGEAVDQWILGIKVDLKRETVSYGLLKAHVNHLRLGKNQDKKGSVSAQGMKAVLWLGRDLPY